MANRLRGADQLRETRLRAVTIANERHRRRRIWCGHGSFAHNLVKIGGLIG